MYPGRIILLFLNPEVPHIGQHGDEAARMQPFHEITDLSQLPDQSVLLGAENSGRWQLFSDPVTTLVCRRVGEIPHVLSGMEERVEAEGLHAAGYLSYEAAPAFDAAYQVEGQTDFPLLWFGLFRQAQTVLLHPTGQRTPGGNDWTPSVDLAQYSAAIDTIKEHIRRGDTYQVNYTFRLLKTWRDEPWKFLLQMLGARAKGYPAFIKLKDWLICSLSPELFFRLDGEDLISKPMKGTAPRGFMNADDLESGSRLRQSEKERAENVMIVDMVRHDMGRIARGGSVGVRTLFDVEKYPTVWQMTSTVTGKTASRVGEIFRALFPPASITGAPRVKTMEIIRDLERSPRKIYTGCIGRISPDRRAQFNVAIRTVLIDRVTGEGEYGVGGGITWQSETEKEYEECLTKALALSMPGDEVGLLETILWKPGSGFFLGDEHIRRLASSALYFSYPCDIAEVREALDASARHFPSHAIIVRLVLRPTGELMIETRALSDLPSPYRLVLARGPVDRTNRMLYHKIADRRLYESLLNAGPGYDDVILWNDRGEVTESTIANIIVEMEGMMVTPPVSSGLLPGVYRDHLLETGKVEEQVVTVSDLGKCSRILLANSVRGLWQVEYKGR